MARRSFAQAVARSMGQVTIKQAPVDRTQPVPALRPITDPATIRMILAALRKILWFSRVFGKTRKLYAVAYRCRGEADVVYLDALDYADARLRVMLSHTGGAIPSGARVDAIGEVIGRETLSGVIV